MRNSPRLRDGAPGAPSVRFYLFSVHRRLDSNSSAADTGKPFSDEAVGDDVCRALLRWCPDRQDHIYVGNVWR